MTTSGVACEATPGDVLAGSDRPLIATSGTLVVAPGRVATEDDAASPNFPRKSEEAPLAAASRGVRASVIRLGPSVHGKGDHGFVPRLIAIARGKGVAAYVADGLNRWPGVHRLDIARLYSSVLRKARAGARYHGIVDEGVPAREIAEVIGRRLSVPVVSKSHEEMADHFGWIGQFFAMDGPASSQRTRESLGWKPQQPGLIADLDCPSCFAEVSLSASLR